MAFLHYEYEGVFIIIFFLVYSVQLHLCFQYTKHSLSLLLYCPSLCSHSFLW